MKSHILPIYTFLILSMLLCGFSLFAFGNAELYLDAPTNNQYDLAFVDSPDTPSSYYTTSYPIWNLSGYIGRIKYIGPATRLTISQTPSNSTGLFYFTHNSIPNAYSEYFLIGKVRGRRNGKDVDVVQGNSVITGSGGRIEIPVPSGSDETYSSTWVDLVLVRKNQAQQDSIPNGDYSTRFTITSSQNAPPLTINLIGYRNSSVPATAWLSLSPDQILVSLSQALGSNKVEVVEAQMNLEGDDYNKNYGVSVIFRDNADPMNNNFKFRYTLDNNATIPFELHRGTSATSTQPITPKVPIIWDNLSFTTANIWKLFITGVLSSDVEKSLAGSYTTTISVEIAPLDSNVQI